MASKATADLSKTEHDELTCAYAALLLQDSEQEISADSLNKVIKASGNEVESYWPGLFAKALSGTDIADLLSNMSSGPAPAAAAGGAAAEEAPKEEEKPKEEEATVDVGNVFGDDDDDY